MANRKIPSSNFDQKTENTLGPFKKLLAQFVIFTSKENKAPIACDISDPMKQLEDTKTRLMIHLPPM